MPLRIKLHVRKSFSYLILGLTTAIVACSDGNSPVAPEPTDESTDLAGLRNKTWKDAVRSPRQAECVLRSRKQNGEYRFKRGVIKLPRGSEHPRNVTRKFIYVSRARPGADPVRFAACDVPATEVAIAHMRRLMQRMNRNAKVIGQQAQNTGIVQSLSAPIASEVDAEGVVQSLLLPTFDLASTDGCVEGGVCELPPVVVIGTPDGGECDPYEELDWECECDGPGVDPNTVPDECNDWGSDDGDNSGGGGVTEDAEPSPPVDGEEPVESVDDAQGANKYGCVGNVEYPQRSASNPGNVDVHATTVCAVALPELYVRVSLSVRKVVMRVGYWDEMSVSMPVALTFVREVRTTATGPCVPGQYRAESEHHATGLEGEYLGSPRRPWRIMTVTCNG